MLNFFQKNPRTGVVAVIARSKGTVLIAGMALAAACIVSADTYANNVRATREGSLIKVRGDNANNHVVVVQTIAGDVYVWGTHGTLVNGVAFAGFPRMGLNALDIRMEGGNDRVTLSNLRIANDLFVNLGAGNDQLLTSLKATRVGANAAVEGSSGNDVTNLTGMIVGEDLNIDGGSGVLSASLVNLEIGKSLTVIGDRANDAILVSMSTVGEKTSIETKPGDDRITVQEHSGFSLSIATDEGNG